MARKIFVRLVDKGTTFFDPENNVSVVSDRVAIVYPTARVNKAIQDRVLDKLDETEGKRIYTEQRDQMRKENPVLAEEIYGAPKSDSKADAETKDSGDAEDEDSDTKKPVKRSGK